MNVHSPIPVHGGKGARRRDAYTMAEVLIALAMVGFVLSGVYSVLYTGVIVAVRNFAINLTSTESRLALDRMHLTLQRAYEVPTLVNASGAQVTGSGPAAGIRFYRYVAAPYVVTIPSSGLSGRSTTIDITCDSASEDNPPIPERYDALVINTTILMTGEANQVRAFVNSATRTGSSGTRTTYRVTLSEQLTGTDNVLPNDGTTVTATLVRPTALRVETVDGQRQLVLLESFPRSFPLNASAATTRMVLTRQVASTGSGNPDRPFSIANMSDRPFLQVALQVEDNRYNNYLRSQRDKDDYASYVDLRSQIPFKCDPNQL